MYNATAVLYALVIPAPILALGCHSGISLRWFKYRERMAAINGRRCRGGVR